MYTLNTLNGAHLCECELCTLAEENFLVAGGVRVVLVVLKPLDEGDGSLRGQLVARCVVREFWKGVGEGVYWACREWGIWTACRKEKE